MTQLNVLTGGPSVGKSSTLREISSRGYYCLPESARLYFDQKKSMGLDPMTAREKEDFQSHIESLRKHMENSGIPEGETTFMDRSFVDNIGYRRAFDSEPPEWLFEQARGRYDKVFILDRLPVTEWEDDDVRQNDEQTAQQVHDEIYDAYVELGYTPIEVPVMTVEKRANFIIERVEELPPIK